MDKGHADMRKLVVCFACEVEMKRRGWKIRGCGRGENVRREEMRGRARKSRTILKELTGSSKLAKKYMRQ